MNTAAVPKRLPRWLLWSIALVLVLGGGGVWSWLAWEAAEQRGRRFEEEWASRTTWTATLFPANVTFRRGAASAHDQHGPAPWRGLRGELATCPDDSEGQDFAEFYRVEDAAALMAQPFAGAEHPEIRKSLEKFFGGDPAAHAAGAVILSETQGGGWKLRATLIPTPHGGLVLPENLPDALVARLSPDNRPEAPEKSSVIYDARTMDGDNRGIGGRFGSGRSRERLQYEAEQRAESEYRQARDQHDRRHHHFYLAEAARDFGEGRVVILRRFGQVYGPGTITRAMQTLLIMGETVAVP